MHWEVNGYVIDDSRERLDLGIVTGWILSTYWGNKRTLEMIRRSWDGSALVFGVYYNGKPVGCARVISDLVTTAYLADVFLVPEHRGRGVGMGLVGAILDHPELATVKWLLHTVDMQPLYRRFGFLDRTDRLMERPARNPATDIDAVTLP